MYVTPIPWASRTRVRLQRGCFACAIPAHRLVIIKAELGAPGAVTHESERVIWMETFRALATPL